MPETIHITANLTHNSSAQLLANLARGMLCGSLSLPQLATHEW
jgi:hypothetical protein